MSKTLLLADDSSTIQRVVELTFAQEDIRVVSVADGEQALKSIERDLPDIVLADVGMPRLDGYSLSTHLKTSPALQHIPVLLLAGAFEPVDETRARQSQCDGVLIKPFEPRLLVTRVQELLSAARPPAPVADTSVDSTHAAAETPAAVNGTAAAAESGHAVPSWYRPERAAGARPPAPIFDTPDLDGKLAALTPALATVVAPIVREPIAEAKPEPLILDLGSFTPVHGTSPAPLGWPEPRGPEPLELAAMPVVAPAEPETHVAPAPAALAPAPAVAAAAEALPPASAGGKVSLATAFTALLAAEQSMPNGGAGLPVGVSERTLEDVVRRVLLDDGRVRRMVLEAAERMVKEEIERIKSAPEPAVDVEPETQ